MKIRTKLILALLLLGAAPILLLQYFSLENFDRAENLLTSRTLSELDTIASIQKSRIINRADTYALRVQDFSSRLLLRQLLKSYNENPTTETQETLVQILEEANGVEGFEQLHLANPQGKIVASTQRSVIGADFSSNPAFKAGKIQVDVSTLVTGQDNDIDLHLSGPLFLDDAFIGVIIIESSADQLLGPLADYTGLGSTGESLLTQRRGNEVIFLNPARFDQTTALNRTLPINATNFSGVVAALGREELLTNTVDYRGEQVLAVTRFIPELGWGIVVKIDKEEALEGIYQLKQREQTTSAAVAALLILVIVAVLYIANSISRPLAQLTKEMDEIVESGKAEYEVSRSLRSSDDEVGELARSFDEVLHSLRAAMKKYRLKKK